MFLVAGVIIERLKEMVAKDKELEKRNTRAQQARWERELVKSKDETDKIKKVLSIAIVTGAMEDNRRLHRIRKEILEDVESFSSRGSSTEQIIEHVRNTLCR